MRDVHCCVTVDYQQIGNGNIANQIHGFTINYGKFILNGHSQRKESGLACENSRPSSLPARVAFGATRARFTLWGSGTHYLLCYPRLPSLAENTHGPRNSS